MGKIPMQQWYPDAHIADTGTLTLEEKGAYRLLMDHLWIKGVHLQDNDKDVARLLRIPVKKWQKIKVRLSDYLLIYEDSSAVFHEDYCAGRCDGKYIKRYFLQSNCWGST